MKKEEVARGVLALIADAAGIPAAQIKEDDWISENLHLSSLGYTNLITELEDRFKILGPVTDYLCPADRTVGEIITLVHEGVTKKLSDERLKKCQDDKNKQWGQDEL